MKYIRTVVQDCHPSRDLRENKLLDVSELTVYLSQLRGMHARKGEVPSVTLKNFGGFDVLLDCETWVLKSSSIQKWRALFSWSSTYKGI